MKIIGHRGAMGLAAENSIESIRLAIKNKVDMIEVDVRVQGGAAVLSHNKTNKSQIYCPLNQALNEIDGKIPIDLDIKELAAVKPLKEALENYKGEIVISSFSFNILQRVKEILPNCKLIVNEKWSGVRVVAKASLLETKKIKLNQKWVWSGFISSLKEQGYEVYTYTVNEVKRALELEEWGVDGIYTDYPNLFKK